MHTCLRRCSLEAVALVLVFCSIASGFSSGLSLTGPLGRHACTRPRHGSPLAAVAAAADRRAGGRGSGTGKEGDRPNQPDGGWAPPPWKRAITHPIKDLVPGDGPFMGIVRNVEVRNIHSCPCILSSAGLLTHSLRFDWLQGFGAFVDIGAERDGFVHVSDISTEFVHQARDLLRSGESGFRVIPCVLGV